MHGSPLPTQRLENFRDGLEDLAYAKLLRERLAANPRVAWADKAERLLDAEGLVASMTDYTADPAAILAWRDAMADLIEKASSTSTATVSAAAVPAEPPPAAAAAAPVPAEPAQSAPQHAPQ